MINKSTAQDAMSRTTTSPATPTRRQAAAKAAKAATAARRDAHRSQRLEAAPAPLWVVSGDWEEGFDVYPLRPGRQASAGETLLADPGDVAHLSGAVTYWAM